MINKKMYEKQIAYLESQIEGLNIEIERLRTENKALSSRIDNEKSKILKRSVVFLSSIYGSISEIQNNLLKELSHVNNENLDANDSRMENALSLLRELMPIAEIEEKRDGADVCL